MLTTPVVLWVVDFFTHRNHDLETASMMGTPWGLSAEGSPGTSVACRPEIALGVEGDAANADTRFESVYLGWIVSGETNYRIRLGVADPDAVLASMAMPNGDLSPATFTMRPSFNRPPGK